MDALVSQSQLCGDCIHGTGPALHPASRRGQALEGWLGPWTIHIFRLAPAALLHLGQPRLWQHAYTAHVILAKACRNNIQQKEQFQTRQKLEHSSSLSNVSSHINLSRCSSTAPGSWQRPSACPQNHSSERPHSRLQSRQGYAQCNALHQLPWHSTQSRFHSKNSSLPPKGYLSRMGNWELATPDQVPKALNI